MSRLPILRVGDRVSRPVDVFKKKSRLKYGNVTYVYTHATEIFYEVRWDDGKIETGLFRHGLQAEPDFAGRKNIPRTDK